jgi:hypothetical protein
MVFLLLNLQKIENEHQIFHRGKNGMPAYKKNVKVRDFALALVVKF